jgi:cellulose synthase/poly-beta-1,6-N-acetylglucosamine synthase-like glycosyltransferase
VSALAAGLLLLAALALLLPALVLAGEVAAALVLPRRGRPAPDAPHPRLAVLVPARDEETRIQATVAALLRQLAPGDRLVVIADNCRDATAARARGAGAQVIVRDAPEAVGKGHALAAGVDFLRADPPAVVLLLDADTRPDEALVSQLAGLVQATGRPAMADYTFAPPREPWLGARLAAFALRLRNRVRPRGLARLGLPCPCLGSGLAVPWTFLRDAPLAHGRTAEDLSLGVELALAGAPALFCEAARVEGTLSEQPEEAREQRRRWEHGHLAVLLAQAPRLLRASLARRDPALAALALDLAVPPLSLWALLWLLAAAPALALAGLGGSPLPAALLGLSGALAALAVGVAWLAFGRDLLPARDWLEAPRYLLAKLPSHRAFLRHRANRWPAASREAPPATRSPPARPGD